MANVVFQCDVSRGILKRIDGKVKNLYLEISDTAITGKGIIYLESSRNEYSGDIDYEIKSITAVERSMYEGVEALIIYVRVRSLYGAQKVQVRLPGLRDLPRALNMLDEMIDANHPALAAASSTPAPAPTPDPAPAPATDSPAPAMGGGPAPAMGGGPAPAMGGGPVPGMGTPASPMREPAPGMGTPASPMREPAPGMGTPASPMREPAPGMGTPASPMREPAPGMGTPASPLRTPAPGMGAPAPAPGMGGGPAPAPGMGGGPAPVPGMGGDPAPAMGGGPAPASVASQPIPQASITSMEEYRKKLEKLEAIYQTGMITEKEYKSSKAEYVSVLNGLDAFFNKVKVNLQYSEVGFLSADEFEAFKKATVEECSALSNVPNDVLRQNLKKLLILNLFEIVSDEEYSTLCSDITKSVQYVTNDPENEVIEKIEKWPILKDCEIISEAQYEQFIKLVADDTKIRMNESLPVLEHKLTRLSTLSRTFLLPPNEFATKRQELVDEMTNIDYSSDSKLKSQITCVMILKNCSWINDADFQTKKLEILSHVEGNQDVIARLQLLTSFVEIEFITQEEYKVFEKRVIDEIFQQYSDISELQKKAQNLMNLKDAGIISEEDFNTYKKKLLSLS